MSDPGPEPDAARGAEGLLTSDRAKLVARRVGPVLLVVIGLLVALAVYDGLSDDTGNAGVSGTYRTVADDESWLGYLPAEGAVPGLSVAELTSVTEGGPVSRRVDFVVPGVPDGTVTLCFVSFEEDLSAACPDAALLGQIERAVGLPYVGLDGPIGALDWLRVYTSPTPSLQDLDYLKR
ncbi:MAG: hypothetical protein WB471_09550 [Nocardioides sp.]